ncbi:hypothetical protein [Caryophanon tenue]|uniref:hypothetical protein n=1 Tax=Caryophanon tenue TaxID=33978 RepID=UPI001470D108|nr:hypothetical protein [Caryophanon tenue]
MFAIFTLYTMPEFAELNSTLTTVQNDIGFYSDTLTFEQIQAGIADVDQALRTVEQLVR